MSYEQTNKKIDYLFDKTQENTNQIVKKNSINEKIIVHENIKRIQTLKIDESIVRPFYYIKSIIKIKPSILFPEAKKYFREDLIDKTFHVTIPYFSGIDYDYFKTAQLNINGIVYTINLTAIYAYPEEKSGFEYFDTDKFILLDYGMKYTCKVRLYDYVESTWTIWSDELIYQIYPQPQKIPSAPCPFYLCYFGGLDSGIKGKETFDPHRWTKSYKTLVSYYTLNPDTGIYTLTTGNTIHNYNHLINIDNQKVMVDNGLIFPASKFFIGVDMRAYSGSVPVFNLVNPITLEWSASDMNAVNFTITLKWGWYWGLDMGNSHAYSFGNGKNNSGQLLINLPSQ